MAETRRVPLTSTGLKKSALQACPSPWHQQRLRLLPTNLMGKFVKSYCVSQVTSEQTPVLQGAGTNSIMWRGLGFKKKIFMGKGSCHRPQSARQSYACLSLRHTGARARAGCCVPSVPMRDPLPLPSPFLWDMCETWFCQWEKTQGWVPGSLEL